MAIHFEADPQQRVISFITIGASLKSCFSKGPTQLDRLVNVRRGVIEMCIEVFAKLPTALPGCFEKTSSRSYAESMAAILRAETFKRVAERPALRKCQSKPLVVEAADFNGCCGQKSCRQ